MFSRAELHCISRRATEMAEMAKTCGLNKDWARTYRKLAVAADELDLRWDKCEHKSMELADMVKGCLEIRFTEHEVRE